MATKKSNLFKLDSNIDGTYFDSNNEVQVIENMIQAVGATDGPAIAPNSIQTDAAIDSTELNLVDDITIAVNTRGHGILYDEKGKPVAYKGDLVFRDGKGNLVNLNKALLRANTIRQDGDLVLLRDGSLQQYNSSASGVSLDDMIEAAIQKSTPFGGGNIVQAVRNSDTNTNTVSVFTVKLKTNNHVWVVGSAMVQGTATIQLRDVSTDTVLDVGYVEPKGTNIVPVFVSYAGPLPVLEIEQGVTSDRCNPYVWNSFIKRYFKLKPSDSIIVESHEIALEIVGSGNFLRGNVNLLAVDNELREATVKTDEVVISDKDNYIVAFDEGMASEDYSISIQAEIPIQTWYDQKSLNGFRIRFDRNYTGSVHWTAVLNAET